MFRSFSQLATGTISAVRQGLFLPHFILTDGQHTYGKLSYSGFFWRQALAETAEASWKFTYHGLLRKRITISTIDNQEIGVLELNLFGRKAKLRLTSGKELEFNRPSFFKPREIWIDPQRGEMLEIESKPLSNKVASIKLHEKLINNPALPLLSLMGLHLVLLKRRRQIAAAS